VNLKILREQHVVFSQILTGGGGQLQKGVVVANNRSNERKLMIEDDSVSSKSFQLSHQANAW